jgi:hypothetical protein
MAVKKENGFCGYAPRIVSFRTERGGPKKFRVAAQRNEGMISDGMWATVLHFKVFENREDAEALLARIVRDAEQESLPRRRGRGMFFADGRYWEWQRSA